MTSKCAGIFLCCTLLALPPLAAEIAAPEPVKEAAVTKAISPAEALEALKDGNARYRSDRRTMPHSDASRRQLAAREGQAKKAMATVLSCSDSRVPLEHIFDAGIMDLFVVRAAGNPANGDEIASIEYGLAHVETPVLIIMGHSQCGAVSAAVGLSGPHKEGGHKLEPNIEPLVKGLVPAVKRAKELNPKADEKEIVNLSIEENVWLSVENLLKRSEVTRRLVLSGSVILAPAVYDLDSGEVRWLNAQKAFYYLGRIDAQSSSKVEVANEGASESRGH